MCIVDYWIKIFYEDLYVFTIVELAAILKQRIRT